MALQVGLVGLPNVGKSTLFNALTNAGALVASYPFTTIEPNVGVVPVPDPRLQTIARIMQPEEVVPATLRVVDIAGLVKGASKGEGLGNKFLGHIRNVDAIVMVVRCFADPEVPHVTTDLDPVDDIETVEVEMALADLTTVENTLERVRSQAKANPREYASQLAHLEALQQRLATGQPLRAPDVPAEERDMARDMQLLTAKPRLYVANIDEAELPEGGRSTERIRELAAREGATVLPICARLEAELVESLKPEEAEEYLREMGLESSGLGRLIRAGYHLLDLITFFTITGGKIARAWTLHRGETALGAAGAIHTDMQRGFIRAEVMHYDDLARWGSVATLRERGLVHIEGRDYVVQDGDIIHIRFNV